MDYYDSFRRFFCVLPLMWRNPVETKKKIPKISRNEEKEITAKKHLMCARPMQFPLYRVCRSLTRISFIGGGGTKSSFVVLLFCRAIVATRQCVKKGDFIDSQKKKEDIKSQSPFVLFVCSSISLDRKKSFHASPPKMHHSPFWVTKYWREPTRGEPKNFLRWSFEWPIHTKHTCNIL